MAGLLSISTNEPTGQQAAEATKPPEEQPRLTDDDETPNVSPEEQAAYEEFVNNGLEVIYGQSDGESGEPGARTDILNRLRESSDPMENLANTAVWLTTMLETSAEAAGAQLPDEVVMHGGRAMLEELIEVAEAAAIHEYSEKEIEGAWYRALDLYRETATEQGRIDPEALKEQFGEIEAADRQGRMGDVLPQLGTEPQPGSPAPPATEEV